MIPKQKRVGLYLRVSQTDQTTDNQRIDLERVAEQRGWHIAGVYLDHGVNLLAELTEEKVAVYLHQQQVDSTTTAGKAMLGMCAVFSEFEWNSTSDRIKAGIARARKEGKRIGRPTTVTVKTEAKIRKLKADNPDMGILKIARTVGCGTSTVQRVLTEE